MAKNTVMEFIITQQEENTKANGSKTKRTAMELFNMQTMIDTKATG